MWAKTLPSLQELNWCAYDECQRWRFKGWENTRGKLPQ